MSEQICGIYKITNLVNGKCYIGQSVDIYRRWIQHKKIGRCRNKYRDGCRPLYRALKKYGIENFSFEILDECDKSSLSEQERYWIKYFDSVTTSGKGYNLTDGGENGNISCSVHAFQYDLEGNFIAEYNSIRSASVAMGLSEDNGAIQNAIGNETKISCGYQWRYEKQDKIAPFTREKRTKNVACYDKTGKLLKTFSSVSEASLYFNVDKSAIGYCCNGKTIFCRGYKFLYYDKKPLAEISLDNLKRGKPGRTGRKIAQFKNGCLLHIFNNAKEVADYLHIKDRSQLYKVCNRATNFENYTYKTYKGYEWKWADEILDFYTHDQ